MTQQPINIDLICDERPSDSPLVQRIWHSRSERHGTFLSVASPHWEMVVTRFRGEMIMTLRGPETVVSPAYCPPDAEFLGIQFKHGAFMPMFPAGMLIDRRDVNLPSAGDKSFWLNGAAWQFPDFDNADTFVDRLVRAELLVNDLLIGEVLRGQLPEVSLRSQQRRFLRATGLTQTLHYQIERARHAANLLTHGVSILDTVERAGYSDQPHLTRMLKRYIGQTPAQLASADRTERLSFLFNTSASEEVIIPVLPAIA